MFWKQRQKSSWEVKAEYTWESVIKKNTYFKEQTLCHIYNLQLQAETLFFNNKTVTALCFLFSVCDI